MYRILAIFVFLLLYGSLYPWDFDHAGTPSVSLLLATVNQRIARSTLRDAVFNFALYSPVGLVAQAAIRQHLGRAMSVVCAAILGFGVSFSVELLQQLQPGRTSSMLDVVANTSGAAFGAVVSALGFPFVRRWARWHPRSRADMAAAVLLFCLAMHLWFPFVPSINVPGIVGKAAALSELPPHAAIRFINVLMSWFAAGMLLLHLKVRVPWVWLAGVALLLPAQVLLSRRHPALIEVAAALIGTVVFAVVRKTNIRTAAVVYVCLLVCRALLPSGTGASRFIWIPFVSVIEGDWHNGALVMIEKVFLYGAGVWLAWQAGFRFWTAAAAIAGLLLVLEVLQLALPGRTPEITDPMIAFLAAFCMRVLGRKFQDQPKYES